VHHHELHASSGSVSSTMNGSGSGSGSESSRVVHAYTEHFQIPIYIETSELQSINGNLLLDNNNNNNNNKGSGVASSSSSTGVVTVLELNMKVKRLGNKAKMVVQSNQSRKKLRALKAKLDERERKMLPDAKIVGKVWLQRYLELIEYKASHGDCLVPRSYQTLGSWVFTQRQQYRLYLQSKGDGESVQSKTTMTEQRIQALEKVGFIWSAHVSFEKRLEELASFKEEYGHVNVPQDYVSNISKSSSSSLGKFVNKCRIEYKRMKAGKKTIMTQDRINALERLGFQWDARQIVSWDDRLVELKKYQEEHNGSTDVSQTLPNGHPYRSLGIWVKNQRYQYKLFQQNKKTTITKDRIDSLNEIDFAWVKGDKSIK